MASTPRFHRPVIVGSESLASAPTMKRWAICLTPVAAIAATGRVASLRLVMPAARPASRDSSASASSSCRWRVTSAGVAHAGRTSTKRKSAARSAGSLIRSSCMRRSTRAVETVRGRGIFVARSVPIRMIGPSRSSMRSWVVAAMAGILVSSGPPLPERLASRLSRRGCDSCRIQPEQAQAEVGEQAVVALGQVEAR